MSAPINRVARPYTYESITAHCGGQISQFMAEAHRHTGDEARCRKERAYGVYMGWRALVAEHTDPATFFQDDQRLEALLAWRPLAMHATGPGPEA